ncbi:MAG: TonB C-terminal domain-containing protein [Deltaproteobacteria bacterium]|nr:TonB C-terminal domain-containing protein [Deltaproteobacteria bacterium]
MATMHESASRLRVAARSVASPPTLSLIAVTPGNQQVSEGAWGMFRAAAVWSDGTREEVTQRCAWSSSDHEIVSVGTPSLWRAVPGLAFFAGEWPGQYIARKQGAATITCAYQGLFGSVAIIVGPLMEIDLDQETPLDPKDEKTPEKKDEKKPKVEKPDPKLQPKKEEIIVAIVPPIEKEMTKEEKLEELEKKKEEPPPVPPPPDDKKIAVQQHQDKEEEPNPEAHYLAEKNHKVKPAEETQAQITSTSENDKKPTPGTHNGAGKPDQPGNGDKTIVAQDDNRPGEKVAPNVIPKGAAPKQEPVAQPDPPKSPGSEKGDDKKLAPSPTAPPPTATAKAEPKPDGKGITAPVPAPAAGAESDKGDPALAVGPKATPTVPSAVPPGAGDGKAKALPTLPPPKGPKWVGGLGYGAKGEKGQPSISIDEKVAKAAIGMDALDKLKKVEGETKLSMHRGQWKSSSLEKWRAAIENYVPGVKPGNQTNLGTAAAPWATYLAQIHVRLHPIFAEGFVDGLGDLPLGHPLNDKSLVTRMEIVIKPDGTLHHLGIVKASGVTAFDIAALDSVDRAAPFGKVPQEIISPDGLAYLHWEFHRDEMRCSNVNAYPYVLKEGAQKAPDPKAPPPLPTKPPEGAPKLPTGTTMGAIKPPNG